MKEEKIKLQAKKWAEMYVESPKAFMDDYITTVEIGRFELMELFIISGLAVVYENYIRGDITREAALTKQNNLLGVYRVCTTKQMNAADVLNQVTLV